MKKLGSFVGGAGGVGGKVGSYGEQAGLGSYSFVPSGGMFTANTMSSSVEALGMALPGNSASLPPPPPPLPVPPYSSFSPSQVLLQGLLSPGTTS